MNSSINHLPLVCFICDDHDMSAQKLTWTTVKGYPTLLAYAEAVQDVEILQRMKASDKADRLGYHLECRLDLYNKYLKVTSKSCLVDKMDETTVQPKRRRTCTGFSTSHGHNSSSSHPVPLLYKNVCILCNKPVNLYPNKPLKARKKYRVPDNLTADALKTSLLKTAQLRQDDWGIEVIGAWKELMTWSQKRLFNICAVEFYSKRVVIIRKIKMQEEKQMRIERLFSISCANG